MAADVCFGGPPETFATEDCFFGPENSFAVRLLAVEGHVLWQEGDDHIAQIGRAHGRGKVGYWALLKAADGKEAFAWSFMTPQRRDVLESKLVAFDLMTGQRRVVLDDQQNRPFPYYAHLAIDGEYLYFIIGGAAGAACETGKDDGFFRMRRDGSGRPEHLGEEPSCAVTRYLIDGGYVYWKQYPRHGYTSELRRRRIVPDAPVEFLAIAKDHPLPMAVGNGRLYYLDSKSLVSVPLDGAAPAIEHYRVEDATTRSTLLHDRGCLYWTADRARTIMRARLGPDGPGLPEVIADQATYSGGPIATDGKHLYWLDEEHKRVMRAGRVAEAAPAR